MAVGAAIRHGGDGRSRSGKETPTVKRKSLSFIVAAGRASALAVGGCARASQDSSGGAGEITMWTHSAGNPGELAVYKRIIADFNASQHQ